MGFEAYDPVNVEAVRSYCRSVLSELETDFGRDGNPVHVWEAIALILPYGIELPDWLLAYLFDAASEIGQIRCEVAAGKPINREVRRSVSAKAKVAAAGSSTPRCWNATALPTSP